MCKKWRENKRLFRTHRHTHTLSKPLRIGDKHTHTHGQADGHQQTHTGGAIIILYTEFWQHGWLMTMYPSNSPITKALDVAFFPALAKHYQWWALLATGAAVVDFAGHMG